MNSNKYSLSNYIPGVLVGILIISLLGFGKNNPQNQSANKEIDSSVYKWYPPSLPEKMDFAGEAVPLERWEIRESFDRQILFNYYMQNNTIYILKHTRRYFPLIEERLKANGVPDDFKYLCVAESNLQHAISRSGAVGFWQFMDYTAPGYNLEISKDVDQRYHVAKATDAACKYIKLAYSKFGSWTAAAASYNCGQGGYEREAAFQQTKNYFDLFLREETSRYIFRILTFKYLMQNAEKMGFLLGEEDYYQPFKTRNITVSTSISNLAQFAIDNGSNYKMLKLLNPWLRSKSLAVKPGKSYTIQLPTE